MSTATEFLNAPIEAPSVDGVESSQSRAGSIGEGMLRFAPVYDWISLIILAWMMSAVGWSVQLAGWGELPSIIPTLLLGMIAAFVVSKLNVHWTLTIVYALGLGFLIVFWQGAAGAAGGDPVTRSVDAFQRLGTWISTAQSGGISTDTVPFAIMFMTASWIVGYGVTALTFRFKSPWLPTVLLSLVILTNLSYRHGEHEYTFFTFLVGGIVLFAHLTTVRRIERWRAEGVDYSKFLGWMTVQDGLLFALPIVLLSALLPIWEPRSVELDKTWDIFRAPFAALREPANRLLAGVDGPANDRLLSTPPQSMAFGGAPELTEEPLMWVRSKYVVPYAGRVYQQYTSEGWLTDKATEVDAEPRTALTFAPDELARERVSLVYAPLVPTKSVMPAGGVFSVDRDSTVEVLNPMRWEAPLTGSVRQLSEMPQDLRDMAFSIRFALVNLVPVPATEGQIRLNNQRLAAPEVVNGVIQAYRAAMETGQDQIVSITVPDPGATPAQRQIETVILPLPAGSPKLNWDEITINVETDGDSGLATHLDIQRAAPVEQIGVQLTKDTKKSDSFSVQTFVSLATDAELNSAGTNYPTWITDRYLQLPATLPEEVRVLASKIVRDAGAVTPFEKAEAVKEFLTDQQYSLEIAGPEFGVDGIYYFLFETREEPCPSVVPNCDASKIKGFSQYFGSSNAVLLRAVGVPARFVAGWASGQYVDDAGLFLIRDEDRHGWSQVYFPEYGWVDYESTPGRVQSDRGELAPVAAVSDAIGAGDIGAFGDEAFIDDLAELERLALEARLANAARLQGLTSASSNDSVIPWRPFAWTGGVVGIVLLLAIAWRLSLRGMDPPTRAYARMNRVARLMGMRRRLNETAREFALSLGNHTFAAREHASLIADEYQRRVYSNSAVSTDVDRETSKRLEGAWRRVARALVAHRVRQLGRVGPEIGEK